MPGLNRVPRKTVKRSTLQWVLVLLVVGCSLTWYMSEHIIMMIVDDTQLQLDTLSETQAKMKIAPKTKTMSNIVVPVPRRVGGLGGLGRPPSRPPPRRVIFLGYSHHYHEYDARAFEQMTDPSNDWAVPNGQVIPVCLVRNNLTTLDDLFRLATSDPHWLIAGHDKWQWVLLPTAGQYKNAIYLDARANVVSQSKLHYNLQNRSDNLAYLSERMRMMRMMSSFNSSSFNPMMQYPVSPNSWHHNVYWSDASHVVPLSYPWRPLVVAMSGEVFWNDNYDGCNNVDLLLMRSRAAPRPHCLTVHYLQAAKGFYRRSYNIEERNIRKLETEYPKRSMADYDGIYQRKSEFCVMIVGSVYKRGMYQADALTRHAMFRLLSDEYKQCHSLGGSYRVPPSLSPWPCDRKLGDIGTFKCMAPYKFVIAMENTKEVGYMSEKLLNAVFADAIPIYFGAPDLNDYVNQDRVIHCNVSQERIDGMRRQTRFHGKEWLMDGPWQGRAPNGSSPIKEERETGVAQPTDNELIDWAVEQLRDQLMPCIAQIQAIDASKDLFITKVRQSILKHETLRHSDWDAYTVGQGLHDILNALQSYIFQDL